MNGVGVAVGVVEAVAGTGVCVAVGGAGVEVGVGVPGVNVTVGVAGIGVGVDAAASASTFEPLTEAAYAISNSTTILPL